MSVTVDHEPLAVSELNLETVGQVFSHLQRENRLVIQVLIDGEVPQAHELGRLRQTRLNGHTLFIETADPRELALEVLDEVVQQINESEPLKAEVTELLHRNLTGKAMEKLGVVVRAWQHAQESITKVTELLRIDLKHVDVEGRPLEEMLNDFSCQLRAIKFALEQRDFVSLSDVLTYETAETSAKWLAAVEAMCREIAAIR